MKAKIVAFEGADCMGKATQSKLLCENLNNEAVEVRPGWTMQGFRATRVEVPVQGRTHGLIYWMLRNGSAKRFPNLFQAVQTLNKLAFQLLDLPRLTRDNDFVILDRWALSGFVYGGATGVWGWLNRLFFGLMVKPDVTFVMHGKSFKRAGREDTYEADTELQRVVKASYEEVGMHWPKHVLVSNEGTTVEVHARILAGLGDLVTTMAAWGS